MSAYQWPREPLTDARWRSDVCRHRHRTREAAERCEEQEWRRRQRSGEYAPDEQAPES